MYIDLEKVTVNFPEISFEKRWGGLGGVRATVPDVYESILQEDFDRHVNRANACLTDMGLEERATWFIEPLTVIGKNKDECASKILDTIRDKDVCRHILNPESVVSPSSGVGYFPVYEVDPFHSHGDPSFIDMSRIYCGDENNFMSPEDGFMDSGIDLLGALSLFFNESAPDSFSTSVVLMEDEGFMLEIHEILPEPASLVNTENEVVMFEQNYGDRHCHMINAETLARKLTM